MAADTQTTSPSTPTTPAPAAEAPPPEAPAPPPAAEAVPRDTRHAPTSDVARRNLRAAFRREAPPAAPPVDQEAPSAVGLAQQPTPRDDAAPAPQAEPAPEGTPAPEPEAATPNEPEAPSPLAEQRTDRGAEAEAAKSPAPTLRPPLPDEFEHEIAALAHKAPRLKHVLRGLWNDPNLSEVGKIQRMQEKVLDARQAPEPEVPDDVDAALAEQGRYQELASRALERKARRTQHEANLGLVAEVLADLVELDPADPEYLACQSPQDLRAVMDRKSPWLQSHLKTQQTTFEAEVQTMKAEHAAELKAQEKRLTDEKTAALAELRAQLEAGLPRPKPFGTNGTPSGEFGRGPFAISRDRAEQTRGVRGLLAAGYRQSERMREGLPQDQ